MNLNFSFQEVTLNKTGFVLDPPIGGGYTASEVLTLSEAMKHLSSAPYSTPPPISCSVESTPKWMTELKEWPKELESFWKLNSAVGAPPNGSSKPKATPSVIFKNGIL